ALTALRRQGHPGWSALSGVAFEVEVKMRVDGKGVESRQGSVLVTHQGFSGPAVMDLSRSAALAREGACVEVVFDFALGYDESALEHLIGSARRQPKVAGVLARELKLPRRLAEFLADDEQERQGVYWSRRPEKTRRKLLGRIRHYPVPLDGVEGFERAEVTAGGVDTADVRHATMESKLVSGLYFAGEILDVDGCVGGYNLQWAWTSGALAGRAAAESLR
ncbi:MAG: NAD(P)/FAD-dependent oxidoreductase, partial [Candidatus Omnitrophota bacterium]